MKSRRCYTNFLKNSIMQVTICANMKGMRIKPGSLGKAVPPYDVQVCWYVISELSCSCGYKSKSVSLCLHWAITRISNWANQSSGTMSILQIIDDRGAILPAGEEGNIAIRVQPRRPFCMFSEYLVSWSWPVCACWGAQEGPGTRYCWLTEEHNFIQHLHKVSSYPLQCACICSLRVSPVSEKPFVQLPVTQMMCTRSKARKQATAQNPHAQRIIWLSGSGICNLTSVFEWEGSAHWKQNRLEKTCQKNGHGSGQGSI